MAIPAYNNLGISIGTVDAVGRGVREGIGVGDGVGDALGVAVGDGVGVGSAMGFREYRLQR